MVHLCSVLFREAVQRRITLKFALGGCTNRPFYKLVVANRRRARDGPYIENLGSYDPMPNTEGERLVAVNVNGIKRWLGSGADMTLPVAKILGLGGILPLHPMSITAAERKRRESA
uniref:small ribosomal subunit protein bS16m n=1 Tax=Myxine glutinosa TaxID=7769 RepID=UPI0035902D61